MKLKLKELRKRAGYRSQEELAQALGVSSRSIANWEQGVSDIPLTTACQICELIECTLDELVGNKYAGIQDPRLKAIANDYEMLNDELKDAAAGAVRGIAFVARG